MSSPSRTRFELRRYTRSQQLGLIVLLVLFVAYTAYVIVRLR